MITTDKLILGTGVLTLSGRNVYVDGGPAQTSFSKSSVLYNSAGFSSSSYLYKIPIWRSMANCTVTGISAMMISGNCTGVINARKNFVTDHLVTDMRVGTTGNWVSSGIILGSSYNIGDTLETEVLVTGGLSAVGPVCITVQVDFIK